MAEIIFVSGPCGCGKSTFADACAKQLVKRRGKPVYVIHGDDFHRGFVNGTASNSVPWEEILRFNWDCIMATAERALRLNLDVEIDYIIEDELPRVKALAERHHAALYYIVLTAEEREIRNRIRQRGDADLIERALFLKRKLDALPENQGHLYDNMGKTLEDEIREIIPEQYLIG